MLVCLCVLASSLVRISFSVVRSTLSAFYDVLFPGDVLPPVISRTSSYVLRPGQGLCDPSNAIRDAALAHLPPLDDGLSLPQSLALNPDQWPELHARSSRQSDDFVPPQHLSESREHRSALRRSRRQQRARATDSM